MLSERIKELNGTKPSNALIGAFNVFYGEYQKNLALQRCIISTADMAADYSGGERPPMVEETWRLTQVLEEQNNSLESTFKALNNAIVMAVEVIATAEELTETEPKKKKEAGKKC